jgi:hypothetical protein
MAFHSRATMVCGFGWCWRECPAARRVPGFSIDGVAAAASDDPEVLRLEHLDTDVRRPGALDATRATMLARTDPGDEVILRIPPTPE